MKQVFFVVLLLVLGNTVTYAQNEGVPLPGAITTHTAKSETFIESAGNAAVVERGASNTAIQAGFSPLPGLSASPVASSSANASANQSKKTSYQLLPISAGEAKTRIEELKTLLLISRPQSIQEQIYNLCDWLSEMYEAHNKLANAFARQDETKASSLSEKASAQRFRQLKNEAQLLKAELLIKQNRSPEALGSLVDIVIADPKSATAKIAYQHLQELGFSEIVPETVISQAVKEPSEPAEKIKPVQTDKAHIASPQVPKSNKPATVSAKMLHRSIVKANR